MSTAPTPAPVAQPTTEQKILAAAEIASQAVSIFVPAAGAAVKAGVAVEPVISGLVQLFIGIFKHHSK